MAEENATADSHPEEITFAKLTELVRQEIRVNPSGDCALIAEKYGISQTTINKLIEKIKNE